MLSINENQTEVCRMMTRTDMLLDWNVGDS